MTIARLRRWRARLDRLSAELDALTRYMFRVGLALGGVVFCSSADRRSEWWR
jgi:hypothetical protein